MEVLVKRRRPARGLLIAGGNVFLALSHSRIRMFAQAARWREREIESFRLLHGEDYRCGMAASDSIWVERMPGSNLREIAQEGLLTEPMIRGAAAELRRAHGKTCARLNRKWSHGDPHLANFLYDAPGNRCRLIDFDSMHEAGLEEEERHADDLLVFLLDLLAQSPEKRWPDWGRVFVASYGIRAVADRLVRRLKIPRGLELVLWVSRAERVDCEDLRGRVTALKEMLENRMSFNP